FIPQWRRDDIMVSYAPKGGSVGQHFDFYDVFLVQGYGHRRWQLGQMCDENTAFVTGQPLKLLPEMDVHFDEVLAPGDLLYVPPGLSHYGVAEDDCLTFSFGFRMPNVATMMDRVSDRFADNALLKNPVIDIMRDQLGQIGEMTSNELAYLKAKVLDQLQHSSDFEHALVALMSEPKYPDNIPEPDEIEADDLREILSTGYELCLEPASRLLYTQQDDQLLFWANGEACCIDDRFAPLLKALADGQVLPFDAQFDHDEFLEDLAQLLNDSVLMLLPPEEE
uniref:ribosomal protein uL16 3-hydroxylase n=1 Tax=uncultured Acinetobacter sp. TaxID=165433 RepID=UPI002588F24F